MCRFGGGAWKGAVAEPGSRPRTTTALLTLADPRQGVVDAHGRGVARVRERRRRPPPGASSCSSWSWPLHRAREVVVAREVGSEVPAHLARAEVPLADHRVRVARARPEVEHLGQRDLRERQCRPAAEHVEDRRADRGAEAVAPGLDRGARRRADRLRPGVAGRARPPPPCDPGWGSAEVGPDAVARRAGRRRGRRRSGAGRFPAERGARCSGQPVLPSASVGRRRARSRRATRCQASTPFCIGGIRG